MFAITYLIFAMFTLFQSATDVIPWAPIQYKYVVLPV